MDKPLLISLNGKYYDIARFANKHPGGEKVLRKLGGEDITKYMDGSERILSVRHAHSSAAYRILERYSIDYSNKVLFYFYEFKKKNLIFCNFYNFLNDKNFF